MSSAAVLAIIVNYRTPQLTEKCLAALRRTSVPGLRAVVVDGGSGDGSAEYLSKLIDSDAFRGWATFMPLAINGGFGWANNQAILASAWNGIVPQYVYLINPDAEVLDGAIEHLLAEFDSNAECGACGSQLYTATQKPAPSAFRFPSIGRELLRGVQSELIGKLLGVKPTVIWSEAASDVDWVTGASVMFRTAALQDVGTFDDGFFLYFEEVELMHRLKSRGWKVRHVPQSAVKHLEGASTKLGAHSSLATLPSYWYASRKRYFALTGGKSAVFAANGALLFGLFLSKALQLLGRSPRPSQLDWKSLFANGIFARRSDLAASVPRLGNPLGMAPAWLTMRARGT